MHGGRYDAITQCAKGEAEPLRGRAGLMRLTGAFVVIVAGGCGVRSTGADVYPEFAEHAGKRIDRVYFENTDPFRADTLRIQVRTRATRCNFMGLPVCVPFTRIGREEHRLNLQNIGADVQTLERFYRIAGYFGTIVEPRIDERDDDVAVTFSVARGDPVVLDVLTVSGTEPVLSPDSLARTLPLQQGEIFHLSRFIESSDVVLGALQRRGHAYAEVLRSFSVDTVDNRAEASLEALPGPRVTIDSIIVRGAPNLGRAGVLRQIEFRSGQLLESSRLIESQRNLYGLELVSLASVTIAPDSLQVTPGDSTRATVLISIAEAPVHEVETAVGFGTEECLRTDVGWVSRSIGGGARKLALRATASRLGVGEPFAVGAGGRFCPTQPADSIFGGSQFNYRLAADFTQPYFLGPRNQLGLNVYAERFSEPGVYQRQAVGGRAGVSRRLGARSGGAVGLEIENGETRASPALFCAAFQVCAATTIDSISRPRFRSELSGNTFIDAKNNPLDPSAGFTARTGVSWAAPWLGSQVNFFRWTADAAYYQAVRPRWVGAFSVRVGNFFRTGSLDPTSSDYLAPEARFFAGGANTVRGYHRNMLGPGIYVTDSDSLETENGDTTFHRTPQFVPTGGTAVVVVNAELRMPSPVMRDLMRLAFFIDAGAVDTRSVWDLNPGDWKITPGVGVRLQTPVGPVRVDFGFNPYSNPTAPLLFSDVENGTVRRLRDAYQEPSGNLFSRLRVHLGVGHAF
ncbi:MAG TPA: BamA/TamA family outer membrane protein [Longimicrobiales bacterium]|nr:BamA/TamA family outer membrane protein [Longimicrobiales bacterium]